MTSLDAGYRNQALVTHGVAIFTDAMRSLVRRELEAHYGSAWWDVGVWPWLTANQRKAVAESRANDSSRSPEDLLDANHFRAAILDAEANYALFARYMPERAQARRALETVRRAKNLLVSHRRSGDTPADEAFAALQAMHDVVAHVDTVAADELARLAQNVGSHDDRTAAPGVEPSVRCAVCAQPLPARAILLERGSPRHVDAGLLERLCRPIRRAALREPRAKL